MYINEYNYLTPTIPNAEYNSIHDIDRESYATDQFIAKIPTIVLTRPTAVLYAGGFTLSENESRGVDKVKERFHGSVPFNNTTLLLRESTAYNMHRWIGSMENNHQVEYASINSNTCASSMSSLYEASKLLEQGEVEEVIIISEGRVSFNTIRLFKENRINLTIGDGFAVVRLSMDKSPYEVTDTKWKYSYKRNPFSTSIEGYAKVDTPCDTIKPHGTGTNDNNAAEVAIVADRDVINYKKDIGHTLSVSALLELCMLIDDVSVSGKVLCTASGVGGFYGSCILNKTK